MRAFRPVDSEFDKSGARLRLDVRENQRRRHIKRRSGLQLDRYEVSKLCWTPSSSLRCSELDMKLRGRELMAGMCHLRLCVVILFANLVTSQPAELLYEGFSGSARKMIFSGATQIQYDGMLRLTGEDRRVLGHAFHSSPMRFKKSPTGSAYSFSSCFAIAIHPEFPKLGGHGLAFVISKTTKFPGARPSQYLGLLTPMTNANSTDRVFFVEFDTVQDFQFDDINDNHVGIDMNSMRSNASAAVSFFDDESKQQQGLNLTSAKPLLTWIDYSSSRNQLNVTISPNSRKPSVSLLSFDVDLSPILEETMFVGFSASTGLIASSHYVLGWSFKIGGKATSLDLSSLPSFPRSRKRRTVIAIASECSAAALAVSISIVAAAYLIRRIKNADVIEDWELEIGPQRFSYDEIRRATKGFRDKDLLGFGGFGRVYRGTLPGSKTQVAVKRISHESRQGLREFISEIASIGRLRHRNLVHLLGWCRRKGDLILVYEFMPNGSLDKYLFNEAKTAAAAAALNWEERFKIIRGVASGLLYLHEEWEQTVIHRDIKSGNVLLDSDRNGRLGDFGLAKLYERGSNPSTTRVVGTLGYLAPELTRIGKPTTGSDVYAFGALLLEVVCGRRPIEPRAIPEQLVLIEWVWERWCAGAALAVVDPKLNGEFEEVEVIVVIKLGLMCSNNAPWSRPTMRNVVGYLEGNAALPEEIPAPDAFDSKKPRPGGSQIEFEDYVRSYPMSSVINIESPAPSASFHLSGNCEGEEEEEGR